MTGDDRGDDVEPISISRAAAHLLEECRMVLPGIQALFGFQLIAVCSERFAELGQRDQRLHLAAIGLIALAIALIMTPAAYDRQTEPREVSEAFIRLSTRLVLASMVLLAAGVSLDFYLIARMIEGPAWGAELAAAPFVVFVFLWFVLPRWQAGLRWRGRPANRLDKPS